MQRVTITKRMKPYALRKNPNILYTESRKRLGNETAYLPQNFIQFQSEVNKKRILKEGC